MPTDAEYHAALREFRDSHRSGDPNRIAASDRQLEELLRRHDRDAEQGRLRSTRI